MTHSVFVLSGYFPIFEGLSDDFYDACDVNPLSYEVVYFFPDCN